MRRARAELQRHFGFAEFRPGQEEVIEAVCAGRDALVVMPTGGGKSLCYQIPALVLPGVTLVVSPLIALMQDQVAGLQTRGIAATMINSSISLSEQGERIEALRRGEFKLVYVAPERFRAQRFVAALREIEVSLMAVDEAHCLSQWGHDFRPDYLRLGAAAQALGRPPLLALTATATRVVREDIAQQLRLKDDALTLVRGFARPNLALRVLPKRSQREKYDALTALAEREGSGIIYCATRKRVEEVELELKARGVECTAYHAGLTDEQRRQRQERFLRRQVGIVVATNAFGMGIDRADLRFIVHFELPGSVEAYYQEVGRAGRDGEAAVAELYYSFADTRTQEFFLEGSNPSVALIRQVYRKLWHLADAQNELRLSLEDLATEMGEKNSMALHSAISVLAREGALRRFDIAGSRLRGTRLTGPEPGKLEINEAAVEAKEARDRDRLARMVAFCQAGRCRQHWILDYFGEPGAADCGQCDVCQGATSTARRNGSDAQRLLARQVLAGVARCCHRGVGHWQGRFGKRKVVGMLRGSGALELRAAGLDRLKSFGMLASEPEAKLLALLDELERAGLVETQGTEYPMVALTEAGERAMKDELAPLVLAWPTGAGGAAGAARTGRARGGREAARGTVAANVGLKPQDQALLVELKALRFELASAASIPAYMVLTNKVLEQLALRKPETLAEALALPGIGPAKAERWLGPFLARIRALR